MLGAMKATGMRVRDVADIGTGTGLLGFAALALWPNARATASDIDAVCAEVPGAALPGGATGLPRDSALTAASMAGPL